MGTDNTPTLTVLWRGNANAWECDELGHLNVRAYWEKAMEAVDVLAARLGQQNPCRPDATSMLVPVSGHVRYLNEVRPGTPLTISGGIVDLGATSMTIALVMQNDNTGAIAAGLTVTCAHTTGDGQRTFGWSQRMIDQADEHTIALPDACTSRGLTETVHPASHDRPVDETGGFAGAGKTLIAAGVFSPAEAAPRGIIGPNVYFARASDGFQHLVVDAAAALATDRVNVAMVEARVTIHDHAEAGDAFELHSGFGAINGRTLSVCHTMVNPITGALWGRLEALCVFFNLETRQAVHPGDGVLSALQPRIMRELVE